MDSSNKKNLKQHKIFSKRKKERKQLPFFPNQNQNIGRKMTETLNSKPAKHVQVGVNAFSYVDY